MEIVQQRSITEILEYAHARQQLCQKIKEILVARLGIMIEPMLISDDQPLFGRGLELDSIDVLEFAVGIHEEFGVMMRDDDIGTLSSINRIADFVQLEMAG